MPFIHRYACNKCGLELPSGWGGYTYAVNSAGERVVCPHPGEIRTIHEVTGMQYDQAQSAGRVGFSQYCICCSCLKQSNLDLDRDARVCPFCGSTDAKSVRELIGSACPKCQVGIIEEGSVIRWQLDPDWESLPVPQIAKELVQFENDRNVCESLQAAAEACARFGDSTLIIITFNLLDWWQGNYYIQHREPKPTREIKKSWTWGKALPHVLGCTPQLAELIKIRGDLCEFREEVAPETWRGIKNYVRKFRVFEVMS